MFILYTLPASGSNFGRTSRKLTSRPRSLVPQGQERRRQAAPKLSGVSGRSACTARWASLSR